MPTENFQTRLRCRKCQGPLRVQHGCRAVHLRCRSCGALFHLKEYGTTLDDLLEEYLGNIPCNRI